MSYKRILLAAAVSLAALSSIAAANAQPLSSPATFVQPNSDVVHVQYREPYGYYGNAMMTKALSTFPARLLQAPTASPAASSAIMMTVRAWRPARGASVLSIRAAVHM